MFSRATRAFSVIIIPEPWLWAYLELRVSELVGSVEIMEHLWNGNRQEQTEAVKEQPLPVLLILHANLLLNDMSWNWRCPVQEEKFGRRNWLLVFLTLYTGWFKRKGQYLGRCDKKVRMNMRLILNGYGDKAVWIYKCKSIVKGNKEREITDC